MYFLYSLGGVTFNKCWITLSVLNCYSPNFQRFILMKNAINNQVGMLGDMFLWLVANLKQGVIYFIKQGGGNHKIAWVYAYFPSKQYGNSLNNVNKVRGRWSKKDKNYKFPVPPTPLSCQHSLWTPPLYNCNPVCDTCLIFLQVKSCIDSA